MLRLGGRCIWVLEHLGCLHMLQHGGPAIGYAVLSAKIRTSMPILDDLDGIAPAPQSPSCSGVARRTHAQSTSLSLVRMRCSQLALRSLLVLSADSAIRCFILSNQITATGRKAR